MEHSTFVAAHLGKWAWEGPYNATVGGGGQFDFVWPAARTMHPHAGMVRPCGGPNEIKGKHPHSVLMLVAALLQGKRTWAHAKRIAGDFCTFLSVLDMKRMTACRKVQVLVQSAAHRATETAVTSTEHTEPAPMPACPAEHAGVLGRVRPR